MPHAQFFVVVLTDGVFNAGETNDVNLVIGDEKGSCAELLLPETDDEDAGVDGGALIQVLLVND